MDKAIEEDLIAENRQLRERNQYLEAELEDIKKLSAFVQAEEQKYGKIAVDEEQAKIVRLIYRKFLIEGMTCSGIAAMLKAVFVVVLSYK